MKIVFLLILTLAAMVAEGQGVPPTDQQAAYLYYKNKIVNPGFENGTTQWTASGGSFTVITSGMGQGLRAGRFNSSASSQTLVGTNYAIEAGLKGNVGRVECSFKTTATDYKLQAYDGTNVVGNEITIAPTSDYSLQGYSFSFPTSGNIRIRIISASDAADLDIDDCYLGKSNSFSNEISSKWTDAGAMTITGSTTNPTKGATNRDKILWRREGSDLIALYQYEQTSAGSGGAGEYIFALPAGLVADTSIVPATSGLIANGNGIALQSSKIGVGHLANGSGARGRAFAFLSTSTTFRVLGEITFSQYEAFASGFHGIGNTTLGFQMEIRVPIQGWGPSGAIAADQTDYGWTAYTPTISNFGTVSSTDCYHSRIAADVLIRCKFVTSTGGSASEARVSLPTGLTSSSSISTLEHAGSLLMNATSVGVLAALIEPSVTYITFSRDSSTSNLNKINGNTLAASGFTYTLSARVPIAGWVANQRAPTLIGSVTSGSTNAERIERAKITNSGTPTISSQSGSWISSLTDNGTGDTTINITSGMFSAAPTCVATGVRSSFAVPLSFETTISTSAIRVRTFDTSGSGAADLAFEIICMGPR